MWYWDRTNGPVINWFQKIYYDWNKDGYHGVKNRFRTFFSNYSGYSGDYSLAVTNGYVITENVPIKEYAENFVTTIPESSKLYFEESDFPRSKLSQSSFKRTIKLDKADVIVMAKSAEVKFLTNLYYIFTDSIDIFAISDSDFLVLFGGDLNKLKEDAFVNTTFNGPLKQLYYGRIGLVNDPANSLKKFTEGYYGKPFILDVDLDKIVNQNLPDPDLESLKVIYEMLNSSDKAIIKLGATMAAGFNISKWPLTFTCVLCMNGEWVHSYNGSNTAIIKQMRHTMNIHYAYYGFRWIADRVQKENEKYTVEDISLAQDFVRTLPGLKEYCARQEAFYLNSLPFIPDEYKH